LNLNQIIIRLVLGAGVSFSMLAVLLFAFSSSGLSINLSKLFDLIRNVSLLGLVWYLITQLLGVWLRSLRYQALLDSAGDQTSPGLKDLFPITLVRNMTVDLLPARVGELVFVGLLKRTNDTHVSHSLTTLVFATLFDIAVILPIVFILALFILTQKQTQLTLFSGAAIILIALIMVYYLMKKLGPLLSEKISLFCKRYQNKFLNKIADFIEELNQAVQTTIQGKQFGRVIWITIALRITKYLGLCLLFLGVVKSSYPQLAQLPVGQLVSILIAGETAASLPIPTFLSLGSYEAGAAGMLSLYGVALGTAVLIMLAVHICSQIIDYTLGLLGVAWLLFRSVLFKNSKPELESSSSRIITILSCIILVIGVIALFYGFQETRKVWSINAPPAGIVIDQAENQAVIEDWNSGPGFIVWSSNRNGNHDIYHMSLPDREITQITDHPHTENFPKISPDGKTLVFQRARKVWQSFREADPWDLVLKDLQSGQERVLAKVAHEPNWTPDGKQVSFRRNHSNVFVVDVNSGEEKKVYQSTHLELPEHAGLQTPMLNSNGELAVTVRGPLRMTAVYKKDNPIHIGQGCQVTWSPDGSFVYYIDHGGKGQNLFKRYDFKEGKNKVWVDMPGDYSHEYFPKLSSNGQWMVFAASTGGHEHDTADYELFLWRVDSDPATAIRLSYHSGNDSWPDIYLNN